LALAMRIETEDLRPQFETFMSDIETLREGLEPLLNQIEVMRDRFKLLMSQAEDLKADSMPIWTDDYNLCGDPNCEGDCRVCQEGEYDGEEEYTEKYCRRGRR
jgi:hypothetical protein